ncbi:unnamed protein product [Brassica rapa subsp. trilocularis]
MKRYKSNIKYICFKMVVALFKSLDDFIIQQPVMFTLIYSGTIWRICFSFSRPNDFRFVANFLGIFSFILVIAYHFVVADPKFE